MPGIPTGVWVKQVSLALQRAGQDYLFTGVEGKDRFGQPQDTKPVVVHGLYHEETRWTRSQVSEEGSSNVNQHYTEAYILCKKDSTAELEWGMTVVVSNKIYRLIKNRDIEALDLFCDLVLEEVQPNGLSN